MYLVVITLMYLLFYFQNGSSFIIFDEIRFSKELLPMYFKHNNMASFVRQLNMCKSICYFGGLLNETSKTTKVLKPFYLLILFFAFLDGFRKLSCIDQGGMHCYRSEIEFYHQYFSRGNEEYLERIKRKVLFFFFTPVNNFHKK